MIKVPYTVTLLSVSDVMLLYRLEVYYEIVYINIDYMNSSIGFCPLYHRIDEAIMFGSYVQSWDELVESLLTVEREEVK